MNGLKRTLAALTMAGALGSQVHALPPAKDIVGPSLALGLSSPCHGLLALRGVYEFNDKVGIQSDIGFGFSGIDFRLGKKTVPWLNTYGYVGVMGISPWIYLLNTAEPDGATFAAELGAGVEFGRRRQGFVFGIEGGLVLPIPPEPNTMAFRIDLDLTYRFPLKKQ